MLGQTAGFQEEEFQYEFLNEYKVFLGSKFGPLTAGDDNWMSELTVGFRRRVSRLGGSHADDWTRPAGARGSTGDSPRLRRTTLPLRWVIGGLWILRNLLPNGGRLHRLEGQELLEPVRLNSHIFTTGASAVTYNSSFEFPPAIAARF